MLTPKKVLNPMPTTPAFLSLTLTDSAKPLHIRWSDVSWIEDASDDLVEGFMDLHMKDGTVHACKRRDSMDKIAERLKLGS